MNAAQKRFLNWAQRIARRHIGLRQRSGWRGEGAVQSASLLLRIEVDEKGRALVQLKEPHSTRPYAADWPTAVGGSVEARTSEALGEIFSEVWHALHEKANAWETSPQEERRT